MNGEAILVAVLPSLVTELGHAWRDVLDERRRRDRPCDHGRPGGRLCAACMGSRGGEDADQ